MKLKKEIVEVLALPGAYPAGAPASTVACHERSEMLVRDLDELSGLALGARERFLVTRIETVLCERQRAGRDED